MELQRLDDRQLGAVDDFEIRRVGYGKIKWEGAIDLLGVNLDTDVLICENEAASLKWPYTTTGTTDKPARAESISTGRQSSLSRRSTQVRHVVPAELACSFDFFDLLLGGSGSGASLAEQQQFAERIDRRTQKMGCGSSRTTKPRHRGRFPLEGF